MPRELNEADVERRLARLEDAWGPFPVERERETLAPERFDPFLANARDGYTGGAYVWAVRRPDQAPPPTDSMPDGATQEADRVLLGKDRGNDWWLLPGGGREDGERYEAAAIREVEEETGIAVELSDLAHAWRYESRPDDGRDLLVHSLFVVFEGRYVDGSIDVQPGELNGAAWFRELPANRHPFAEPLAADWDA